MAKAKIDLDNNIINIFGEDIKISFTKSGRTKQLLLLLMTTTVDDLSPLVLQIYLQNYTMKNLK